jgi:bis(5'-adenosyl)-triphosphatase
MLCFGKFRISPRHVFFKSAKSAAFVNLRPIVPGHTLVIPQRIVARLDDLAQEEYVDLWNSVRVVQRVLEQHYQAEGFNVSVQDGLSAGQSVPHVHVHILPRKSNDFEPNDIVYDKLEEWAPREEFSALKPRLSVPEDSKRHDRTVDEMAAEAALYRDLLK